MTKKIFFIILFCTIAIIFCSCRKKFVPDLPNDIASNDFAGALTGFDTLDLRTIFAVSDGYSSSQKNIILDTNFLFIPNLHILTPHVVINIESNGAFNQTINISLTDTIGRTHENLPVVLSGKVTNETLLMNIQLTVNEKAYNLNFLGKRDDYASLINGKYYGTYALGGSTAPGDSIYIKRVSNNVVSLIANTKIGDTPVVTDEEVIITKEISYCLVNIKTTMDIEMIGIMIKDVPTEIVGKIKASDFYLEVMFTVPFFPAGLTMTFTGVR